MGRLFPLSVARKNLSELVNQAYYEGKLFGISKGKKPMGVLVGAKEWKEIIETIEMHDWSYPVSVDTWQLGVMGYEAEQLRTGLVSPPPNHYSRVNLVTYGLYDLGSNAV